MAEEIKPFPKNWHHRAAAAMVDGLEQRPNPTTASLDLCIGTTTSGRIVFEMVSDSQVLKKIMDVPRAEIVLGILTAAIDSAKRHKS